MTFIQAIKSSFTRVFHFKGRSSRSEFWYSVLFYVLLYILFIIVMGIGILIMLNISMSEATLFIPLHSPPSLKDYVFFKFLLIISVLVIFLLSLILLFLLFANFSLAVRRLHDINKSGWYVLLWIVIFVIIESFWQEYSQGKDRFEAMEEVGIYIFLSYGMVILWQVLWFSRRGDTGENRFGANPLEALPHLETLPHPSYGTITFAQAVGSAFKRAFDFTGRASRTEFWYYQLLSVPVGVILMSLNLEMLFIPFLFISLSLAVRRLHDINKAGWYILPCLFVGVWPFLALPYILNNVLLVVVPILLICFFIWLCRKGDEGTNRFGPNPLTHSSVLS